MILPDQTPKLPKWPFLACDAALLAAAWVISQGAARPLPVEAILAIVGCVAGAGIAGAIPFLADYARRQDEALDNRQRALEKLARDATEAAEQISIAARSLHDVAGAAQRGLTQAGALPGRIQEQIAAFTSQAEKGRVEDRRNLEKELGALRLSVAGKLQESAEGIAAAAADLARLARKGAVREEAPAPAPQPAPGVPEPPVPAAPPVAAAAVEAPEAPPSVEPLQPAAESPAPAAVAGETPPAPKPPPRKRAPRKPAPEPAAAPAEPVPAPVQPSLIPDEEPAATPSEFTQSAPDEDAPPASLSADGATRLLVTAYIGIGNRLFIRGEGPGLNWESGVPLQFVSIGKWRWDTDEAAGPVRFKLYKNDEIECASLGQGTLEPGRQLEVTASF